MQVLTLKQKTSSQIYREVKYPVDVIVHDGDLILDGETEVDGATLNETTYSFGDSSDLATASTYAQRTVVLKVNGDLIINSGITLTSIGSAYGGPKGMIIYVTGELINNGTISMTAKGAKAVGENVYLWQNENNTFEYVPASGAGGGGSVRANASNTVTGATGSAGSSVHSRATGGGRSRRIKSR